MEIKMFLETNYDKLLDASRNITRGNELADELLHYSILELMEKKNLQDILDSGGTQFYIIRIMLNSWKSTSSPFYRTYRLSNIEFSDIELAEAPQEDNESSINIKEVEGLLERLNWYDRELFKLYADGNYTISQLARETKIPRTSINLTINRVKKYLKKNMKYEN